MAKSVNFNIKLKVDGKEHLITASTNVRKLADELGLAQSKSGSLGSAMAASMRDISILTANAMAGIQQLTAVITDWTAAAQIQQEAEVKLETVMRQRMAATEDDVTAIKELAKAQQQLGIIGDEVQLAGAQQVATFLTERQALETLLPAMNNLIAQQRGYNATASDAVSIGNLMGKAMQGQTSALTRVGITFNEAQEAILKTGTEMERAATLAEVITDNVGEMNAALAATDAGKAKQLSNDIGDLKEQLGGVFSSVQPAIVAVGQLGLALTALGTMASGVRTLTAAFTSLNVVTKLSAVAMTAWNKAAVLCRYTSIALTTALKGTAVSATAAKVAIKGLMIATGAGAALAVLVTIIEKLVNRFSKATDAAEGFDKAAADIEARNKKVTDTYAAASAELEMYRGKIEKAKGSQKEEAKLVDELNDKYGESMGYFSSLADWYKALTANGERYCEMLANQIRMQNLAAQLAEQIERQKAASKQGEAGVLDFLDAKHEIERIKKEAAAISTDTTFTVTGSKTRPTTSTTTKATKTTKTDDEQLRYLKQYEAGELTINSIQAKINALKKEQGNADLDNALTIQEQVDALEELKKGYTDTSTPEAVITEELETDWLKEYESGIRNIAAYEAKIADLREQQKTATSDQYKALEKEIADLETAEDAFKGIQEAAEDTADEIERISGMDAFTGLYKGVEGIGDGITGITDALENNETAWEKVTGVVDEAIRVYEGITAVAGIIQALTTASQAHTAATTAETVAQGVAAAATEAGATAAATQTAITTAEIAAVTSLTNALMQEAAAQYLAAHAYIPFAGFAIGSGYVAAATALVQAIGAIPFAEGGIVSGPTLALVGEYGGATSNPEVIAPLDKLRSMMNDTGGGGNISLRVRGRDLVGAMANETRIGAKSGRRTNISI